jgi:hypothetical protein
MGSHGFRVCGTPEHRDDLSTVRRRRSAVMVTIEATTSRSTRWTIGSGEHGMARRFRDLVLEMFVLVRSTGFGSVSVER